MISCFIGTLNATRDATTRERTRPDYHVPLGWPIACVG